MKVEYTALKRNYELYENEYHKSVERILKSGWYILGPELEEFERRFAEYIGVKYCVGVNSGTDALILAIRALGIGTGDEVIVPAGTYIASVLGITENGATPVYVDSNEFLLMDTLAIEKKINEKTRAILPVHMYGQACDMDTITKLANRYNLYVIEDCAQCHGATWNEKMTGSFGDISCFSFYPTKPLGAFGDAGALVTNDPMLHDKLKMLRNYGSRIKYYNESIGVNSRLDEIQSAVLNIGLNHLDETNSMRKKIADRYLERIQNTRIAMPTINKLATHVFHLFPILVDDQMDFQEYLLKNGVKTQVHYPIPPYVAECYRNQGYVYDDFPRAAYIAKHEVSLPIYAGMPDEEVEYVISVVNSY